MPSKALTRAQSIPIFLFFPHCRFARGSSKHPKINTLWCKNFWGEKFGAKIVWCEVFLAKIRFPIKDFSTYFVPDLCFAKS